MLSSTLRWREHVNVEAAFQLHFPDGKFSNSDTYYGKDREGRPIGNHISSYSSQEDCFTKCLAIMEHESRLLDFETIDQVIHVQEISKLQDMSDKNCKTHSHYPGLINQTICLDNSSTLTGGFNIFRGSGGVCPCGRGDASSWLESMTITSTACCALIDIFHATNLPERGAEGSGNQDPYVDNYDHDFAFEGMLFDSPVVLQKVGNPAPRKVGNPAPRRLPTSASTTNVSLRSDIANGSPMQVCVSSPYYRIPSLIASATGSPMKISPANPVLVMAQAGEYGAAGVWSSSRAPQNEAPIASNPVSIPSPYFINAQREWDDLTARRFYVDNTPEWPVHPP